MVLAPRLERGERRRVWEYLRFYLLAAAGLGLALTAAVWAVSWLHVGSADPHHQHPLAWIVLAVPINAAGAMVSRTLQSARRPAQAALPWRIGLPALQLVLFGLIVGVHGGVGLIEAILIGVVAVAAIAAGYRDAHAVLVLLTAGNVAWAAAALPSLWLQYRGRAGVILAISIATLIADSILNLLLIPRYGMTGAAAGTAATLAAAGLAVWVAGRARGPGG